MADAGHRLPQQPGTGGEMNYEFILPILGVLLAAIIWMWCLVGIIFFIGNTLQYEKGFSPGATAFVVLMVFFVLGIVPTVVGLSYLLGPLP